MNIIKLHNDCGLVLLERKSFLCAYVTCSKKTKCSHSVVETNDCYFDVSETMEEILEQIEEIDTKNKE